MIYVLCDMYVRGGEGDKVGVSVSHVGSLCDVYMCVVEYVYVGMCNVSGM